MAALRQCPSSLTAPASAGLRLTSCPPRSILRLGRRSTMFRALKMQTRNYRHDIRAHEGTVDQPVNPDSGEDADILFREEMDRVDEFRTNICDTGILDQEATALSRYLCTIARDALKLASEVMNCAVSRLGTTGEISLHTTKQTISMYVCIFVSTAEDSYYKKVRKETIDSFLGALQGVAAISHILVQDIMPNRFLSDDKDDSSDYLKECNVDEAQLKYQEKMNELKNAFMTVRPIHSYKILWPTLSDAIAHTKSIVRLMIANHERALSHVQGGNSALDDAQAHE